MTITSVIDMDIMVEGAIQKIRLNENLTLPLEEVIQLTNQLKEFELGQGMLNVGGLTSSLVDYVCHTEVSPSNHPLENWILSSSPKIRAARERYFITRDVLQDNLHSNMVFGVFPCGVISKVAELDYSNVENIKIVGYDHDVYGLAKAEAKMQYLVDQQKINLLLLKKNVWLMDDYNEHDLIISNRLSVLEADPYRVLDLFKRYYLALKVDGLLVTSFFTPSPLQDPEGSCWKDVNAADMLKEHSIFVDILDFHPAVRHEHEMIILLQKAGFEIVDIYYDTHRVYPTILAKKA